MRRLPAVVALLTSVTVLALAAAAFLLGLAPQAVATPAAPAPTPVIVVGAPGLAFSDIDPQRTPTLVALAERGAIASMTVRAVRTRSCAVDGWLTLSAGRRATDLPGPCREPAGARDGVLIDAQDYQQAAADDSYDAHPGTLGQRFADRGLCLQATGPGAQIATSDLQGRVNAAAACPVQVIDAGTLPAEPAARAAALTQLDAVVAGLAKADPGADLLVAGVGDGNSTMAPRALIAAGPSYPAGTLTSSSTRQPALVQLQDLTATLLERVGADTGDLTGRPITVEPDQAPAAERIGDLAAFEGRAVLVRALAPQITGWLAGLFAVWAAFVGWVLWHRRELPGQARIGGVAVATIPIVTIAVNLVPWWRLDPPGSHYLLALIVVVAALTWGAMVAQRRWRLGALRLVALVTFVVLAADLFTGSGLQVVAPFAQNPIVGGRFYGLGNASFALYGLAVLVLVHAIAARPRWRLAAGAAFLVVALLIEAAPSLGADFGGPPGLLLGGLVVLAGATGARLSRGRIALALLAAGVLVAVVAVADWSRPAAQRTHLGAFVDTVLRGEAAAVIGRKLAQNLANLGSAPLLVLTIASVGLVLVASRRLRASPAVTVLARGAAVLAVVGFLLNDSGLVIPVFVAVVLLPLLAAAPEWTGEPTGSVSGGGRLDELDENAARVLGVDEVDP